LLNRDNEVLENLDNSTDENYEEEYSEETNYENKWDVKVVIERNVNTISGEFTYQNPLLSLLLEQNFTTPNYFLYNESAVRDFPGVSGVNYFDLEREATKLRVLEKE
ncbi:21316_t:CDS:2, partial [Rhizophagus irregularis]